jgi:diguanylate cyclase (GGDEF)-like protein
LVTTADPRDLTPAWREWRFWLFVSAAAVAALAVIRLGAATDITELGKLQPSYWVIAAMVVIGELWPVAAMATDGRRPTAQGNGLVASTTFVFAVLIYWGLGAAIVIQIIGVMLADLPRRKAIYRTIFNISQYTISWAAAHFVLTTMVQDRHPGSPLALHPRVLPAIVLAAVAYFLVNDLLVSIMAKLHMGGTLRSHFFFAFGYHLFSEGALLALAPIVVIALQQSPWYLPLLLVALIAVQQNARVSNRHQRLALHDELTGLANRKLLYNSAVQALTDAREMNRSVGVLFLDLDHFKSVNDTLGHHVGDQLLQDVANRLTRSVRADDIVSRVGGDEFAVLLPGLVDQWTAAEVADRVSDALAAPFSPHGEAAVRIDLGGSIGIAFYPAHGDDVDTLFQRADAAMYTAKSRGLDSVVYSDDSTEGIGGAILTELREALQSGPEQAGLAVHYQPQVELGSGEVVGVEALVRWQHHRLGWIAPTEFVPMAERGVLIGELTRWMLDTSLAQLRHWEDAGLKLRVAVNISVRDLQSVELADFLARRLVHYQLPADRLRVEIDDASTISGRENVQAALRALEDLGVGISLDHFGIGYCSLTRLRRLPVSEVKIDSSFVSQLTSDDDDAAVVRSIVDLANALELAVVAEGVEDEPTWRALAALGCNGAQGNYFAHPMPPEDVVLLLRDGGRFPLLRAVSS